MSVLVEQIHVFYNTLIVHATLYFLQVNDMTIFRQPFVY